MGEGLQQRILVVDDEAPNRELLRALLTAQEYVVSEAEDGEEGMAAVREAPPDLVLLDVMMPGKSGFEICRDMKAEFAKLYVPIILLTALEDVDSIEQGFEAGADDFISKPVEPRVLFARIRSSLRTKALWDELTATQDKLIEAERLAVVGEMTVTLKHEINNPLQAIIGYADYLLSDMPPSHEYYPRIQAICKGGERIAELLAKLDQVRRFETTDYLGGGKMVDVERSTDETAESESE